MPAVKHKCVEVRELSGGAKEAEMAALWAIAGLKECDTIHDREKEERSSGGLKWFILVLRAEKFI